jgi:hypothetical protein
MNLKDILIPKYDVHLVMNEEELKTKIEGNMPSVLTALSHFIESLKESGINEKLIRYAVEQGFEEKKDIDMKEIDKKLDELINKIFKK